MVHDFIDAFLLWQSRRNKEQRAIPLVVFWEIWKARNSVIFEEFPLSINHIVNKIVLWMIPSM